MGTEPNEGPRPKIHPEVRREHVVKLAAAANDTGDLKSYLICPDGEMSARISESRSGHTTEVTAILHDGLQLFAWTTDHGTIGSVEDIAGTLGAVRHRLVMRDSTCRP
ncbi:hypothetical protein GCM10022254_03070 [Actinomadura meridiana]|uniref:Uncharacterized protein n=1 Tax=Actinomadura meridiana TaxID=559626 RepID=A0ABP8BS02_9ACTN